MAILVLVAIYFTSKDGVSGLQGCLATRLCMCANPRRISVMKPSSFGFSIGTIEGRK